MPIGLMVGIVAAIVAVAGASVGAIVCIRGRSPPTAQANNEIQDDSGAEMEAEPDTWDTLEPTTITTMSELVAGRPGSGSGPELGRDIWDNLSDEID
jgi:hypothetical protein